MRAPSLACSPVPVRIPLPRKRYPSQLVAALAETAQSRQPYSTFLTTFPHFPAFSGLEGGPKIVIIRTITHPGAEMHAFTAGTLAGAGSFRCETCGFAVSLKERDEIPECPHCNG